MRLFAWVLEFWSNIVFNEVENRGYVGISCSSGLLLSSFGDTVQKCQDFIRRNLISLPVIILLAQFWKDKIISPVGIFFGMVAVTGQKDFYGF